MDLERRGFIRVIGGGVIAAAALPVAGCSEVPEEASAPWRDAGTPDDLRRRVVSWALLAPNPHNIQPWLVDLGEPDAITLYCDRSRLLPETDPYQRQIVIGHGCFLELLALAAGQYGRRAEITYFPDGAFPSDRVDDRPVAHIRLPASDQPGDPLFAQIPHRRSTKEVFDATRTVDATVLGALRETTKTDAVAFHTSDDEEMVTFLRDITWRAHLLEMSTERTLMESVELMRIGREEILRHRDGIDLGGTFFEVARLFGLVSREAIADPESTAFQQGLDKYRDMAMSGMAFGWLNTPGNDRVAQLQAGRAYARLNLKAAELGLAMHPWSQVLQEYPEMSDLQAEFNSRLGVRDPERVQMLFRLGYADDVPQSPRRPLEALIRTA